MAIGLATSVRNSRLNVVRDAIDAGGAAGSIKFYAGTRPATGGALSGNTLLATLAFSYPSAANAASGVLTFSAITDDTSADADGTALWARIADSNGTFVADVSVGEAGSGADIIVNTANFVTGGVVTVTSAQITEGAA